MKIVYEMPKGQRIKRQFTDITIRESDGGCIWWEFKSNRWVDRSDPAWDTNSAHSTHHTFGRGQKFPRTEKALIRYLKRFEHILRGHEVHVMTRWVGHNATVNWG